MTTTTTMAMIWIPKKMVRRLNSSRLLALTVTNPGCASIAYDDSEEELMELDDFKPLSKGKQKAYDLRYTSLSQTNVEERMNDDVEYVCSVLSVDVIISFLFILFLNLIYKWYLGRLCQLAVATPFLEQGAPCREVYG